MLYLNIIFHQNNLWYIGTLFFLILLDHLLQDIFNTEFITLDIVIKSNDTEPQICMKTYESVFFTAYGHHTYIWLHIMP